MKKRLAALFLAAASAVATPALADVYNLKVVTDANPDYSDMTSLIHSITSRWDTDADKCWALFYWNHIARRQTNPMFIHGMALTDPIRQFNDYGYTMCSTISGVNCSIWQAMGYKVRYNDVAVHTVPEVFYDGRYHMYDNSLSAIYTLEDGKTIADLPSLGLDNGKLVKEHCLNASSNNGFLEGADTFRELKHLGEETFNPNYIKYRDYYNDSERGHRYILNLRDGETYTRTYAHKDELKKGANDRLEGDPNYYVTNVIWDENKKKTSTVDPERSNPRYHIRGTGERAYVPAMKLSSLSSSKNLAEADGALVAKGAGEAVFKVEGANVICSMAVDGEATGKTTLAVSTTNGMTWTDLPTSEDGKLAAKLRDEVNGQYEVLVKVGLADGASLKSIKFNTITEINSKAQPSLRLGANTVYVGAADQTESIVVFPELQGDKYKPLTVESVNLKSGEHHEGWHGVLGPAEGGEGYMVYKIDAPHDLVDVHQQARMYLRNPKGEIRFEHSFDGGKTWIKSYTFNDPEKPWDDFHDQLIKDIPAGTRSILLKYNLKNASLYSVRMEAHHKVASSQPGPVEVTFNWAEKGEDYKLTDRSYTQLVEKLPATFKIDVGGFDQPVVKSLVVNAKGARGELKYGYSDGKDVGGEKFVGQWVTYGKNLAEGKPYTASVKSDTQWGAGEDEDKILTDGVVGSSYGAGMAYKYGVLYPKGTKPEVVIDLGSPQKFAAVRAHIEGYPGSDAIKGEVKDKIEVLTSDDGKDFKSQGEFDFRLYWKDIPVNFMWTDEETFAAHNHTLQFKEPITARYVKFAITPVRQKLGITELQVIESIDRKPFDLKIALPTDATSTAQAAK